MLGLAKIFWAEVIRFGQNLTKFGQNQTSCIPKNIQTLMAALMSDR